MICKNGAQEKKTLSLKTGKRIAAKLCTQGCLKRTWLTSEGIFVRFLGVLRGECAHCKNNGRDFFNRERILHCKPVNAPFTLVHICELLHLRHSLDSNTALGFASCPLNCASRAIIHVQYLQHGTLTNTYRPQVSHIASVGLAQAHPNKYINCVFAFKWIVVYTSIYIERCWAPLDNEIH